MEDGCSSVESNRHGNGTASKFLTNLPSRGLFSSTVSSANLGGMRIYVCDHETTPPDDQVIKTDQMNILIRSLTLKKQQGDATESSRKRASGAADGRNPAKRTMTNNQYNARQSGSSSRGVDKSFQGLTVDRLRALLKEKGLSHRGKKDELLERLRNAS
ncbi:unnamed protein product [Amaranthus hypochondriacus]